MLLATCAGQRAVLIYVTQILTRVPRQGIVYCDGVSQCTHVLFFPPFNHGTAAASYTLSRVGAEGV